MSMTILRSAPGRLPARISEMVSAARRPAPMASVSRPGRTASPMAYTLGLEVW
jgi:hypothetical protein